MTLVIVDNFVFVFIVLLEQFLLIVYFQMLGSKLGLFHLFLHFQKIRFELLHQFPDCLLVRRLDISDATFVSLLQFETLLLKFKICITLLC